MATSPGLFRLTDDLLRGEAATARPDGGAGPAAVLLPMILGFGMFYGAFMGTYGGLAGDRVWQLVYSAVKVPLLILVTFALSIPSFFVINALLGLRADFGVVVRALLRTQAGLTVILSALSPYTAFWYVSGTTYHPAILFNGAMFAVASLGAQWILRREYRALIRKDVRHLWMLRAWIVIYVFVGIQMAWVLRPFIGDPLKAVQFFREGSWSNAYEEVWTILSGVLSGRGR